MSKERARARQTRLQARAIEVEQAARRQARRDRRAALVPALPVRRRRRYGALPTVVLARLVLLWFAVQGLALPFLSGLGPRFAFGVLTAACLAVYVRAR